MRKTVSGKTINNPPGGPQILCRGFLGIPLYLWPRCDVDSFRVFASVNVSAELFLITSHNIVRPARGTEKGAIDFA